MPIPAARDHTEMKANNPGSQGGGGGKGNFDSSHLCLDLFFFFILFQHYNLQAAIRLNGKLSAKLYTETPFSPRTHHFPPSIDGKGPFALPPFSMASFFSFFCFYLPPLAKNALFCVLFYPPPHLRLALPSSIASRDPVRRIGSCYTFFVC